MKLSKVFLSLLLLIVISVKAQAQIKVEINLGTPPVWGPPVTTQQYYFLPDIESYYDIRNSQYVYLNNGAWIRSNNVPSRFRNYNFKKGRVVVLNDYRGRSPYINFNNHKVKYKKNNAKIHGNKTYKKHGNNGSHGNNGHGKNKKN